MSGRPRKPRVPSHNLWFALTLSFASVAHPETLTDPVAAELKRRGDEAIELGHFDDALLAYTKALATESSAALHYNRGRALQGLGRNSEALTEFELFDSTASPQLKAAVADFDEMKAQVSRQIAEVRVECNVENATLRFGEKSIPLPLKSPLRFDPSTIEIAIVAPNYDEFATRLTLSPGDRITLKPELKKSDLHGTLTITSQQLGTVVTVDGKTVGSVPVDLQLTPGGHRLQFYHRGYREMQTAVVLQAKEKRRLDVKLERLPAWYETWWFWTAAGAVAATGVATVVAFSTERPAGAGDIAPGRISAPIIVQIR